MTYPIAEIFHSIQGEGFWTGTPMMFIRLAGCNVGYYSNFKEDHMTIFDEPLEVKPYDFPMLKNKLHSVCTTFDGQEFCCDTDYHSHKTMELAEIFNERKSEQHVCITGGEPFLHDLAPLISLFHKQDIRCHIETSGTINPPLKPVRINLPWITCSPKRTTAGLSFAPKIFELADEWKVLVGSHFNKEALYKLDAEIPKSCENRYLQPIQGISDQWPSNLQRCLSLLDLFPHWRLSAQLHKYIGAR